MPLESRKCPRCGEVYWVGEKHVCDLDTERLYRAAQEAAKEPRADDALSLKRRERALYLAKVALVAVPFGIFILDQLVSTIAVNTDPDLVAGHYRTWGDTHHYGPC